MKTPQQIINEVEKGCGKLFKPEYFGITCGERSPLTGNIMLCGGCENKLSILTEYDKSIKEMIKGILNPFNLTAEDFKDSKNEWFYFRYKELLSKIGSKQEVLAKFQQEAEIGDNSDNSQQEDEGLHKNSSHSSPDTRKGCGKDCSIGLLPYICGKTEMFDSPKDNKGKIFLCPNCKKYEELGGKDE